MSTVQLTASSRLLLLLLSTTWPCRIQILLGRRPRYWAVAFVPLSLTRLFSLFSLSLSARVSVRLVLCIAASPPYDQYARKCLNSGMKQSSPRVSLPSFSLVGGALSVSHTERESDCLSLSLSRSPQKERGGSPLSPLPFSLFSSEFSRELLNSTQSEMWPQYFLCVQA